MNHAGSIIALAWTACLISGCAQPNGRSYLTASEIDRLIIGKGLREASANQWKESFLPGEADAKEGSIWGRSPSELPYTGTWSMDGDRICVDYGDESGGCYRLSMEAHGENTLVGDLSLPIGPAPHPAIAFVHGAGPSTRHSSYLQPIRDELLRRGFASLIWSKPGVDESTGDHLEQSMDDRAGEVEAAMSYLATRADVDRDRIGLWGGSQAGWVVPRVAARRKVAFMILVSCPADDVMSEDLYVAENVLALLIPEGERAQALDAVRSYHDLIRASGTYEEFSRGQESLLAEVKERPWYSGFLSSWATLNIGAEPHWFVPTDRKTFHFLHGMFVDAAPPRLEDLRSPLLAIHGTRDIVVDWKLGSSAYARVPAAAGNRDVTVELFEGADHALARPDREGYLDFAPGYLTTMGEWLSKRR